MLQNKFWCLVIVILILGKWVKLSILSYVYLNEYWNLLLPSILQVTKRLVSHPCIVTVVEMGSARHFLRTTLADKSQEERYRLLQPTLEINPRWVKLMLFVFFFLEVANLQRLSHKSKSNKNQFLKWKFIRLIPSIDL